jgi:hypothetical protein
MKALQILGGWLAISGMCAFVAANQVAAASVYERSTTCASSSEAIRTFTERVEDYAALHRQLARLLPVIDGKPDYGSTWMSRAALAAAIRQSRSRAHQGEIFGGPIEEAIMCRLARAERNADGWLAMIGGKQPLLYPDHPRVNESYYSADVLAVPELASWLPPLPEELEYVVIGSDLVLWDIYADLVVDFLPDALLSDEGWAW